MAGSEGNVSLMQRRRLAEALGFTVYAIAAIALSLDTRIDTASILYVPKTMVPPLLYQYAQFTYDQDSLVNMLFMTCVALTIALPIRYLLRRNWPAFAIGLGVAFIGGLAGGVISHIVGNAFGLWEDGRQPTPLDVMHIVTSALQWTVALTIVWITGACLYAIPARWLRRTWNNIWDGHQPD